MRKIQWKTGYTYCLKHESIDILMKITFSKEYPWNFAYLKLNQAGNDPIQCPAEGIKV